MIADLWTLAGPGVLTVAVIMLALWLLGLARDNFSYVDIGWSANFAVLALLYAVRAPAYTARTGLIAALFCLHGLRLAWHLGARIIGHPEEGRYAQLRRDWSRGGALLMNAKFLLFFELQALSNVVLMLPLLLVALDPATDWQLTHFIGVAVILIGLIGETMADAELAAFKRNPAHRHAVCDTGLWHYSRHPNYFFEWLVWIGYAVFAFASPQGWLALVCPLLMLHFLINVTGVKPTEAQALRSKGERYRIYQERTSTFVPWIPRSHRRSAP